MPRRLRIHVPGGFYHVTLRGNHRQPIFRTDSDRHLLNKIVARAIEKHVARLHAYCWMSNHLHFLMQVGTEPLAGPMRQIASEFARAMQIKLETTGHFFERRFHATLIEATDYLLTALRYIHRNPLDAQIAATLDGYRWSSHQAYAGRRQESWLTTTFILEKFATDRGQAISRYRAFMAIESGDMTAAFPEGAFIFGSDEFIQRIHGATRRESGRLQLQDLIVEACRRFEVQRDRLSLPGRDRYLTKVRAWIAKQASAKGVATISDVARAVGRSEGALRRAILLYPDEVE